MTVEIASQMIGCETSASLWKAITEFVGANTRSRITFLKSEFQQLKKGSLKMREYLAKMKSVSDNLTLAGCPLSLTDLVTQTLAGLDTEYTPIVVLLSEKDHLSWSELQSKLLTYESRLEQLHSSTSSNLSHTFAGLTISSDHNQPSQSHRGRGRGGRRGRGQSNRGGRGYFSQSKSDRPWCYLCDKPGHEVANCFKRFDKNFKPPTCKPNSASAYITTPETTIDPAWYLVTGATHHVTNSSDDVGTTVHSGINSISVGNGSSVHVIGSGHAKLLCDKPAGVKSLNLNDILVSPMMSKKLISGYKLTNDNSNVFVEINSAGCFVKDKSLPSVLLQGKITKGSTPGLYRIDNPVVLVTSLAASFVSVGNSPVSTSRSLSLSESWH
ncbi:hypothetical protein QN277_013008 [Acacia crassicarpa]|uniref:Retrovirus-related Pol polyprotein from transposon TNT 1-94-like beta-barrel domain-containing protein n=1 Tax=Acacia crassicarpa TaxID=499986 RepID=A0AAE1N1M4_9FABA|nr:hypothetical protein QN277_013008 [Acacia crassicarpa]